MSFSRREFLQSGVALTAGLATESGFSQTAWPEKPVRIINGFGAGGASDVLTRLLAERLQARFGQTFIVENRTGAGGNISMEAVATAPPDGYTISSATIGTLTINQYLFAKLNYDPVKDFAYVSTFWENCNVFAVSKEHPAKTLQEWLAWARKKPDGVTFSSSGVGTTPHLSGELFRLQTGIKATHVPFRGGPQAAPELAAGRIDFAIDNVANQMPMLRSGKVKALAVTSSYRWQTLPDIPTMAEAGVPDFVVTSWGALVVPAGTPLAIVNKLAQAVQEISKEPAMQEKFLTAGARFVSSTPQEAAAFAARERVKWKEAVRVSGARVE